MIRLARAAVLSAALALAGPLAAQAPAPVADVDVLDHPVARGEPVTPADFVRQSLPAAQARNALSAEQTIGKEAVRPLSAGMPVRASDLVPVQLVRRGESVTILVVDGALSIATAGRALSGGGQGEGVRVFSNATGRTLDGVVTAHGKVLLTAS